ncbi:hypothetical protein CHCC20375_1822 [Bacillus licheniformis]|nr:hypothetical protein CHCC20375_1822 [Bacillus licheniformis]
MGSSTVFLIFFERTEKEACRLPRVMKKSAYIDIKRERGLNGSDT